MVMKGDLSLLSKTFGGFVLLFFHHLGMKQGWLQGILFVAGKRALNLGKPTQIT